MKTSPKNALISRPLLRWYDACQRNLPWRISSHERKRGISPDPYHVWLSEVMLQQTTVATVIPYFQKFIARWPTVHALADAPLDAVLAAWAGLGYYSRARNLHACAKTVVSAYNGQFPRDEKKLQSLAGIGAYTAAAIAAIAFDQPANVVDGNVERVMARFFASKADKKTLKALAAPCVPARRAGDYAQALMDLGATRCTPKNPHCTVCPLAKNCQGKMSPHDYPARGEKTKKPVRSAGFLVLLDQDGRVWLRRRPTQGLLGGMMECPSTPWLEGSPPPDARGILAALAPTIRTVAPPEDKGEIRHVFTHFTLHARVVLARIVLTPAVFACLVGAHASQDGGFFPPEDGEGLALPTLMRKVLVRARKNEIR